MKEKGAGHGYELWFRQYQLTCFSVDAFLVKISGDFLSFGYPCQKLADHAVRNLSAHFKDPADPVRELYNLFEKKKSTS